MKSALHFAASLALLAACTMAQASDPKATIADLDARLAKIGMAKLEGTDAVAGKTVPAIYFGDRKINNNFDVVDAVRKAHSATATVFVKDGDEFVRVSTNVLTPEGKRGIGTQLARNAAYASVSLRRLLQPDQRQRRQDHWRELHRAQKVNTTGAQTRTAPRLQYAA
jgi:Cache 3/Cache 2 fusion domain